MDNKELEELERRLNSYHETQEEINIIRTKVEGHIKKEKEIARNLFKNWATSELGKKWKEAKYLETQECVHCKIVFPIRNLEIDHIAPISKLGIRANKEDNYQFLCSACNRQKGGR